MPYKDRQISSRMQISFIPKSNKMIVNADNWQYIQLVRKVKQKDFIWKI